MTHAEIIRRHGYKQFASAINVTHRAVRAWQERNSIPARYWPAIGARQLATVDELMAAIEAAA